MFIKPTRTYYDYDGTQHAARQWFLIMTQSDNPDDGNEIRCFVRKVALSQFGHFMMGNAQVHGHNLTISGSYGSDGLPKTVPYDLWQKGVPLPNELYELWTHGGGWNSSGNESTAIRQWANDNFDALAPKRWSRERW